LSVVVSGFGIGWLMGVTTSPVVQIVVGALVSAVVGITAVANVIPGFSPLSRANDDDDSPRGSRTLRESTSALLVVGILIGSASGIAVRTRNWLAPSPSEVIETWSSRGLDRKVIAQRLFDQVYPGSPTEDVTKDEKKEPLKSDPKVGTGVLFSLSVDECNSLRLRTGVALINELATSPNEKLKRLSKMTSDTKLLSELVELLCAQSR
jgi:hypothetical protein